MVTLEDPSDDEGSTDFSRSLDHLTVDSGRLVDQVLDHAIFSMDVTGVIESWNTGAQRLKGYTAEQAIGRNFSMLYSEADRVARLPQRLLARAAANGSVEHTGWRVRRDGSQFWGDVIITALHDEAGELTGFAKVTRDRTPRKRLEDAQDSFFAAFTHDFRTPLSAIKAYSELLRDAEDDERGTFLDRIDHNADELFRMVVDLVTYARTRVIDSTMRLEELDVTELCRETAEGLASILDTSRLVLPTSSIMVLADRGATVRVLENLVTNALKYSLTGPVQITTGRSGCWVRVVVSDQGRGIAPDDLLLVFEEGQRGRLATADGGTGLGLTSVRTLVRQQGGRVLIDSVLGRGTTVTVELPSPLHLPVPLPGTRVNPLPDVA